MNKKVVKPEVRYIEATFPKGVTVEIKGKDGKPITGLQGQINNVIAIKLTRRV